MAPKVKFDLTVVITTVSGYPFLHKCIDSLVRQQNGLAVEVIVPYTPWSEYIKTLKADFPQVTFIEMGSSITKERSNSHAAVHEIYDRYKTVGLASARGKILALLDDNGIPDQDWVTQVFNAHRLPYGVIGGAVEHIGKGALNWAVYFHDFGRYQLPLTEGAANYLTDVNISYKREALELVREHWKDRYNEVTVNWALTRRDVVLWRKPDIIVRQDRGNLVFSDLIRERFSWGRLFGYTRTKDISTSTRLLYLLSSPFIPVVLVSRMAWQTFKKKRNRFHFIKSFTMIVLLTSVWSLGEILGYLTGQDGSL